MILAGVIVQSKIRIAVGCRWRIITHQFFINYQALRLELYRLQVVSEFELNVCHFGDARGNIRMHRTVNLQKHVYCLTIEIKSGLKMALGLSFSCLIHQQDGIFVRNV